MYKYEPESNLYYKQILLCYILIWFFNSFGSWLFTFLRGIAVWPVYFPESVIAAADQYEYLIKSNYQQQDNYVDHCAFPYEFVVICVLVSKFILFTGNIKTHCVLWIRLLLKFSFIFIITQFIFLFLFLNITRCIITSFFYEIWNEKLVWFYLICRRQQHIV